MTNEQFSRLKEGTRLTFCYPMKGMVTYAPHADGYVVVQFENGDTMNLTAADATQMEVRGG